MHSPVRPGSTAVVKCSPVDYHEQLSANQVRLLMLPINTKRVTKSIEQASVHEMKGMNGDLETLLQSNNLPPAAQQALTRVITGINGFAQNLWQDMDCYLVIHWRIILSFQ